MEFHHKLLLIAFLSWLPNSILAQYDTPNDVCGGWFKSQPGTIQFKYLSVVEMQNHACVWTINPASPSAYSQYSISISRTPGLACNATTDKVSVSHFELGSTDVSTSYTWSCGTPITRPSVPGTVIVVVFTTPKLVSGTGFSLNFNKSGDMIESRLRNVQYNWGTASSDPFYFASGFFRSEISTYAFARGNNTDIRYKMNLSFTRLRFDCQFPDSTNLDVCLQQTPQNLWSSMLICEITDVGTLKLIERIAGEGGRTEVNGKRYSGQNGVFLLIWGGDYNYAGGSMQLDYETSV